MLHVLLVGVYRCPWAAHQNVTLSEVPERVPKVTELMGLAQQGYRSVAPSLTDEIHGLEKLCSTWTSGALGRGSSWCCQKADTDR
jgi:hypothetical protein